PKLIEDRVHVAVPDEPVSLPDVGRLSEAAALPRVVRKELAWPEPALDARRAARVLPDGRCVETETRLAFAGIAHRVGEAREREEKHELLGRDAGDLEERSRLDGVMLDRGAALEERVWKLREGRAIREGLGVHVDLRD